MSEEKKKVDPLVALFNQRLILEVMSISEVLRKNDKEANAASYAMFGNSPVGKIITYLESDNANAQKSPEKVIEALQNSSIPKEGIGFNIIKKLSENVKQLSKQVTDSISNKTNALGADSAEAAKNVLKVMKTKRSVPKKYDHEKFFETSVKEMKEDKSLSSYANLRGACRAVQDYLLARRTIRLSEEKTSQQNLDIAARRSQLSLDLKRFGSIGECFDNSRMIGGKPGTSYSVDDIDTDSIRAIVMYSKQAELEMECRALQDPILATHLKDMHLALKEGNYDSPKSVSTHYDLVSTMQQIEPKYYVAAFQAAMDIINTQKRDADLTRVFQNGFTKDTSSEEMGKKRIVDLANGMIKFFNDRNIQYDSAKIDNQLKSCLQILENFQTHMLYFLQGNHELVKACDNLYGINSAGKSNFTESNIKEVLNCLKEQVALVFSEYEKFFNQAVKSVPGYKVPNQTTKMVEDNEVALNPIAWLEQSLLMCTGTFLAIHNKEKNERYNLPLTNSEKMIVGLMKALNNFCNDQIGISGKDISTILLETDAEEIFKYLKESNLENGKTTNLFRTAGIDAKEVGEIFPQKLQNIPTVTPSVSTTTTTTATPTQITPPVSTTTQASVSSHAQILTAMQAKGEPVSGLKSDFTQEEQGSSSSKSTSSSEEEKVSSGLKSTSSERPKLAEKIEPPSRPKLQEKLEGKGKFGWSANVQSSEGVKPAHDEKEAEKKETIAVSQKPS